jgi:hypothetical protein
MAETSVWKKACRAETKACQAAYRAEKAVDVYAYGIHLQYNIWEGTFTVNGEIVSVLELRRTVLREIRKVAVPQN